MNKTELGRQIFGASHIRGSFRLRSGRSSDEYFDKYLFEAHPRLLHEVAAKRVVVVEDVVTSGGQIIASTTQLRALGATISDVLCVIDQEAGGITQLAKQGLTLHALFTMSELRSLAQR